MNEMSKEQLLDTLQKAGAMLRVMDAFRDGVIETLDNDSKDAEEKLDHILFLVEESGVELEDVDN